MIFGSYKAFDGFMRQVEALKFQVMLNTSVRDMCSSDNFIFLGTKIGVQNARGKM
jgi:hypothetical protein